MGHDDIVAGESIRETARSQGVMDDQFTTDWTTHNFPIWRDALAHLRDQPVRFLEVGSWEGRSALFFLDLLPKATITCVDTFTGQPGETPDEAILASESRFDANMAPFRDRVEKIKSPSASALAAMLDAGRRFDVIFVDGSHQTDDVAIDSALAWPLLSPGGTVMWDDYAAPNVAAAVDAFRWLHRNEIEIVHRKYLLIARRLPTPRQPSALRDLLSGHWPFRR